MKNKAVRKIKNLKYIDGNGKEYILKEALVLDLTKGLSLEKLIELALKEGL